MKKIIHFILIALTAILITQYGKGNILAQKNAVSGTYMTDFSSTELGKFQATYDFDTGKLTIEVVALSDGFDPDSTEVRIMAGVDGTDELLLLKRTKLSAAASIEMTVSRDTIVRCDKIGIETADGDIGEGSRYALGTMPGNAEANE